MEYFFTWKSLRLVELTLTLPAIAASFAALEKISPKLGVTKTCIVNHKSVEC
ncbi:hypothetical protein [Nostoc sphaeroides]|uniref:Uncharacterized protein n=1 Tax=Nostoc sphaeroides CCNUC1 TaxID=2653204 RepID=A0A5P8WBS0_9NOSO|nr:hypothetical protein [Nostoc sphaeroides]MCC5632272.1 hypothetical protein [Nostoc sphaeroides CHAB 2801]QFS50255.1 hypothetical protein GXM_07749 [Nostoc sphaeroides CCNUC1]